MVRLRSQWRWLGLRIVNTSENLLCQASQCLWGPALRHLARLKHWYLLYPKVDQLSEERKVFRAWSSAGGGLQQMTLLQQKI
jgi:hypothetical protein